ncbi:DHH family phosphoesterase [Bengtsoniella intestinalis]|uniref:DHH family phosphoesterase n=1 Tax=Bengtsoniella intestinalis TaxID=3073143 RepID=UPI00391F5D9E
MLTVPQTAQLLQEVDNILILTHIRPDGDTIGSASGLCEGLRSAGKTAYLLPNPELTRSVSPYALPYHAPSDFTPDFVVSCDIASLQLLPKNATVYADKIDLAIDHHPSFEGFGKQYIVRPKAAACAEIVYDIVCALGKLTPEMALPLYLGISTDTGCFVYTNTTARTHEIAWKLMQTGCNVADLNKAFFRTKSRKQMQLEGAMLDTMTFHDEGRIVVLAVPMSLMARVEADESDAEDLSSLGAMIEGTDCAVTMRELSENKWKLSVRTGKRINASAVCQVLGGGGHAAAAGCTIEGTQEEAKAAILAVIAEQV